MNDVPFNFSEFMNEESPVESLQKETIEQEKSVTDEVNEEGETEELDVQKAVVEELAAEKIELHEKLTSQEEEFLEVQKKYEELSRLFEEKKSLFEKSETIIHELKEKVQSLNEQLEKKLQADEEMQPRNPNALALLDRDVDLPDRFLGETRDHVLEVLKEARAKAEEDGRIRRAQILESVLLANEPNGLLEKKRAELEKLFNENNHVISGAVIDELKKHGISYKNGENYLLTSEIMKRTF